MTLAALLGLGRTNTSRSPVALTFRICSALGCLRSTSFDVRHNQRTYPRVGARSEHLIGSQTDVSQLGFCLPAIMPT